MTEQSIPEGQPAYEERSLESTAPPVRDPASDAPSQGLDPDTPAGAIVVTVFLAATILVFWFGMFFLNLQRSG